MILQQIQGTTLLLHFAGKKILVDPALSFNDSPMPLSPVVGTGISMREILLADAVILTSLYPGRFDDTARNLLPKTVPVYVQDRMDQAELKHSCFTNVQVIDKGTLFGNISLTRTPFAGSPNGVLEELARATPCTLGTEDILKLHHAAEKATLITCHIEAFHQWGVSRELLCRFIQDHNLTGRFLIPENGKNYYL